MVLVAQNQLKSWGKYLLFVGYGYSEYGSPQSYPNKTDPKHCLK